jgi:hypothetical protein
MITRKDACEEAIIAIDFRGEDVESHEFWPHDVTWKQQYEIWHHGNDLIERSQSQQDLHAGIMQLQRAVEQRDTILQGLYRFTEMPWFSPMKYYDIMEDLRVIRPRLKRTLRDLRNVVAHEVGDVNLEKIRCEELSDIAWYYLKATDLLVRQCAAKLDLTIGRDQANRGSLTISFARRSWILSIVGSVPDALLLRQRMSGCLTVQLATSSFATRDGVRRLEFSGVITGSQEFMKRLLRVYFGEAAL